MADLVDALKRVLATRDVPEEAVIPLVSRLIARYSERRGRKSGYAVNAQHLARLIEQALVVHDPVANRTATRGDTGAGALQGDGDDKNDDDDGDGGGSSDNSKASVRRTGRTKRQRDPEDGASNESDRKRAKTIDEALDMVQEVGQVADLINIIGTYLTPDEATRLALASTAHAQMLAKTRKTATRLPLMLAKYSDPSFSTDRTRHDDVFRAAVDADLIQHTCAFIQDSTAQYDWHAHAIVWRIAGYDDGSTVNVIVPSAPSCKPREWLDVISRASLRAVENALRHVAFVNSKLAVTDGDVRLYQAMQADAAYVPPSSLRYTREATELFGRTFFTDEGNAIETLYTDPRFKPIETRLCVLLYMLAGYSDMSPAPDLAALVRKPYVKAIARICRHYMDDLNALLYQRGETTTANEVRQFALRLCELVKAEAARVTRTLDACISQRHDVILPFLESAGFLSPSKWATARPTYDDAAVLKNPGERFYHAYYNWTPQEVVPVFVKLLKSRGSATRCIHTLDQFMRVFMDAMFGGTVAFEEFYATLVGIGDTRAGRALGDVCLAAFRLNGRLDAEPRDISRGRARSITIVGYADEIARRVPDVAERRRLYVGMFYIMFLDSTTDVYALYWPDELRMYMLARQIRGSDNHVTLIIVSLYALELLDLLEVDVYGQEFYDIVEAAGAEQRNAEEQGESDEDDEEEDVDEEDEDDADDEEDGDEEDDDDQLDDVDMEN